MKKAFQSLNKRNYICTYVENKRIFFSMNIIHTWSQFRGVWVDREGWWRGGGYMIVFHYFEVFVWKTLWESWDVYREWWRRLWPVYEGVLRTSDRFLRALTRDKKRTVSSLHTTPVVLIWASADTHHPARWRFVLGFYDQRGRIGSATLVRGVRSIDCRRRKQ